VGQKWNALVSSTCYRVLGSLFPLLERVPVSCNCLLVSSQDVGDFDLHLT
jgi:hypothetical protein